MLNLQERISSASHMRPPADTWTTVSQAFYNDGVWQSTCWPHYSSLCQGPPGQLYSKRGCQFLQNHKKNCPGNSALPVLQDFGWISCHIGLKIFNPVAHYSEVNRLDIPVLEKVLDSFEVLADCGAASCLLLFR